MRQALAHGLTRLEQQVQARNAPGWPEGDAAVERLRSHAVATPEAVLHRQDSPARDETQAHADSALVERWCRAQGIYQDPEGARAWLEARLTTIAARYAAEFVSQC